MHTPKSENPVLTSSQEAPKEALSPLQNTTLSSKDGKTSPDYLHIQFSEHTDIIRFGYTDPYSPPKVLIQTNDPKRVQQLKLFGLAVGSTPTAQAIATIGGYLQSLLRETGYGYISSNWKKKWAIAQKAQKALLSLEQAELDLAPGDIEGQYKLKNQIIETIDEALKENEKASASLFNSSGRLYKTLLEARNKIQYQYKFPFAKFTPEDQLHFEEGQTYIYDSSMHLQPHQDPLLTFKALYERLAHQTVEIELTDNIFKRQGLIYQQKNDDDPLNILVDQNKGFFRKIGDGFKSSPRNIGRFFTEGVYDFIDYFNRQRLGIFSVPATKERLLYEQYQHNKFENEPKKSTLILENTDSTWEDELLAESDTDQFVIIQARNSYKIDLDHDNLLSQLIYGANDYVMQLHNQAVAHPFISTLIATMTAITFGAMITPKLMIAILNKLQIPDAPALVHALQSFTGSEHMSIVEKIIKGIELHTTQESIISIISNNSNRDLVDNLRIYLEDPLVLTNMVLLITAFSLQAQVTAGEQLNPASKAVLSDIGNSASIRKMIEQNGGSPPQTQIKKMSLLGALLSFGIQLTFPPVRLILAPFVALPECWRLGSLSPMKAKVGAEAANLLREIKKAGSALWGMLKKTLNTIYQLITLLPNIVTKSLFMVIYTPFATIAHGFKFLSNQIRPKATKSPIRSMGNKMQEGLSNGLAYIDLSFKRVSDVIIDAKYGLEKYAGRISRFFIHHTLEALDNQMQIWFNPQHPKNRLSRMIQNLSEIETLYQNIAETEAALLPIITNLKTCLSTYQQSHQTEQEFNDLITQTKEGLKTMPGSHTPPGESDTDDRHEIMDERRASQINEVMKRLSDTLKELNQLHGPRGSRKTKSTSQSNTLDDASEEMQTRINQSSTHRG